MSGFKNIKDEIVATLNTVSSVKSVFGKEAKIIDTYPAACVSGHAYQGAFQTLGAGGSNKETYHHVIRLYFRTDEANDPDYEDVLESVADDVVSALRSNIKLNGSCDYAIPSSGQWKYAGGDTNPVRVFEIIETSTVLVYR